ncbi:hypothetical protein WN944_005650 [Citrus x changshan-huyou]|uniref:Uncharacterized protein n=1 Tax=Citrus x changshan-huyou TaxID=2935761 RepID=A0AAP0MMU6_9ROSI
MTVTLLAAAAGTTLLPKLSTPTHESTIHPSNLPAFTNTAKGKEKLVRPALKTKTSQNPSHNPDAHLDVIRPSRPLTIRDPTLNAPAPGGATIILGDGPTTSIDHTLVGFNSHCSDVPDSDNGDEDRRPGLYHSDEDTPLGFRV